MKYCCFDELLLRETIDLVIQFVCFSELEQMSNLDYQNMVPSSGCGRFLFSPEAIDLQNIVRRRIKAGAMTHFLISTRSVSRPIS